MEKPNIRTSELLNEIIKNRNDEERMSISEINQFLHERGFGLLLILFSFPMAIPLPYPPGFTTILGIPLIFYSLQMILGKNDAWLPKWVGAKTLKVAHLRYAIEKSRRFFKFVERIMKPRLTFMTSLNGERVIGIFVFLSAVVISLPIWGGNAIPSLGIFIMSLGLLNKDGLIVIIGIIISVIGLIIAIAIAVGIFLLGAKAVKAIIYKFVPIINHIEIHG